MKSEKIGTRKSDSCFSRSIFQIIGILERENKMEE